MEWKQLEEGWTVNEKNKSSNKSGAGDDISGPNSVGRERPHVPDSLVAVDNPDDFKYEGQANARQSDNTTARRVSHFSEVDNPDDLEEPQ